MVCAEEEGMNLAGLLEKPTRLCKVERESTRWMSEGDEGLGPGRASRRRGVSGGRWVRRR